MPWFGIIEIVRIKNVTAKAAKKEHAVKGFKDLKDTDIRFVHYPDCQQLIIWLPQPGREYGMLRLINKKTKKIADEFPVTDKLSGTIQLLWDTSGIKPGEYSIEIDWKDGGRHRVELVKYKKGETGKKKQVEIPAMTGQPGEKKKDKPIVYRDGTGKIIPDEDLLLREKVNSDLARKFSRRIEYSGNLRSGTVIYIDRDTRIEFSNEMGGGKCMAFINIPTVKQWEAETKTSLSRREEILEFVAETVRAHQASNCYFEIKENEIGFYYK